MHCQVVLVGSVGGNVTAIRFSGHMPISAEQEQGTFAGLYNFERLPCNVLTVTKLL